MVIKRMHDLIGVFIIGDVNRVFTAGTVENQQDCSPLDFQLSAACD